MPHEFSSIDRLLKFTWLDLVLTRVEEHIQKRKTYPQALRMSAPQANQLRNEMLRRFGVVERDEHGCLCVMTARVLVWPNAEDPALLIGNDMSVEIL